MIVRDFLLRAHLAMGMNPNAAVRLLQLIAEGSPLNDGTILNAAGPRQRVKLQERLHDSALTAQQLRAYRCPFLCYTDDAYPQRLRETAQPPLVLFYQGDLACLTSPCLAIIGARVSGQYSLASLRRLLPGIPPEINIVSGLAYGADGFAHQVALETGHRPIGVIGTPLDRFYPRANQRLQEQVAARGLLLSEYPPGMLTRPMHFVARNRIIAGLSHGLLVTEAARKSGSLITANMALEAGRNVFALPNRLGEPLGIGTNDLLQQGATLVTESQDILRELRYFP